MKPVRENMFPVDEGFHYPGSDGSQQGNRPFDHWVRQIYEADSNRILVLGEYTSYYVPAASKTQNQYMQILARYNIFFHGASFVYCIDSTGSMS